MGEVSSSVKYQKVETKDMDTKDEKENKWEKLNNELMLVCQQNDSKRTDEIIKEMKENSIGLSVTTAIDKCVEFTASDSLQVLLTIFSDPHYREVALQSSLKMKQ